MLRLLTKMAGSTLVILGSGLQMAVLGQGYNSIYFCCGYLYFEQPFQRIIDRKKHMFKTQYGEYIAPERLEVKEDFQFFKNSFFFCCKLQLVTRKFKGIFAKSPYVDQLFVYGNTLQDWVLWLAEIQEFSHDQFKSVNILD